MLLVFPDALPIPSPSGIGGVPLPPSPSLIGWTAYVQGVVRHGDPLTFLQTHDLSAPLQVAIL